MTRDQELPRSRPTHDDHADAVCGVLCPSRAFRDGFLRVEMWGQLLFPDGYSKVAIYFGEVSREVTRSRGEHRATLRRAVYDLPGGG